MDYFAESLGRLRERLEVGSRESTTSEVIIMNVIMFAVTHLICGEYRTVGPHVEALRRIVKLQEGYSKSRWKDFLELRARKYVDIPSFFLAR